MNDTNVSLDYLSAMANLFASYLDRFDESHSLGVLAGQLASMDLSICDRKNMVGHLTASALLLDGESVLLIHHKFLNRWLQPGGHLNAGELPADGAQRELFEETGLNKLSLASWHTKTGLPIDIDSHQIPANQEKKEGEHLHHDFQYVFTCLREPMPVDGITARLQAVELQLDEVSDFKWVSVHELRGGSFGKRLARVADKLTRIAEPA